jgi:DSP-PTPase phosphatase fused to NAD+ Kinase
MTSDFRNPERGARFRAWTEGFRLRSLPWLREFGLPAMVLGLLIGIIGQSIVNSWYDWFEKRVVVVVPGQLIRGAFQRPGPLRRLVEREKIKTIVTLAALPEVSDRFRGQARVVERTGIRWIILPILDSRPSIEQMARAADLLADRRSRPIFFHCIAGHHRTSLAQAAYRIRYEGWSTERAWREVSALPWARPHADAFDHRQIENFAAKYGAGVGRRRATRTPPGRPGPTGVEPIHPNRSGDGRLVGR